MSELPRHGDMQIKEDIEHTRKVWAFERFGWAFLALLLLSAAAGLFGRGPLAQATIADADGGVRLEYERFGRRVCPLKLTLHVPETTPVENLRVWVDREYLDKMEIKEICPVPLEEQLDGDRLVYVFPVRSADEPGMITFHLEPQRFGSFSGRMGIIDEPPLAFDQVIYP
jgi:hypothetical protein